ncbi:MAG: hypothetical protein H0S77_04490 [Spirochaetaceae bacterium]|uniref:Flagellar biosynthesis protein FlhF n=1 Tax=Sphaerochaeta halotolerans TaxID=2293840 RepID=A0A372MDL0_9SPIR|nr:hypothetical protein [Sphaerochaeta halotolerans]MBG0766841.1 hypothetical protein [Spirochaetaceae bacterium]RFU93844.1 hypothetical protein DYP60_12755 [Sphaerochaeta halotolerans]
MEFLTLEAEDYEHALREARTQWGSAVRVHARKDFQVKRGLHSEKRCRITFFLVDETEPTEESMAEEPVFNAEEHLSFLIEQNEIPATKVELIKSMLLPEGKPLGQAELEVQFFQFLLEDLQFEDAIQQRYVVLVGPAGVGKTTSLVKLAIHLRAKEGKKVALLSFDVHRPGALEQVRGFAKEYSLPLYEATDAGVLAGLLDILETYDHVLVDTTGRSSKDVMLRDSLSDLFSSFDDKEREYTLVVSASSKFTDLLSHFALFNEYHLKKLLVTKLDETQGIGNILLFAKEVGLPISFLADGQGIPEDFHRADASLLVPRLRGFNLELNQFFPSL